MSAPHDPDNRDAKSVLDGVTGHHNAARPRRPSGPAPGLRASGAVDTTTARLLPPGDPSCRPLPSPVSIGGRALVAIGLLIGLHAVAAYLVMRELEASARILPRLYPNGFDEGPVLEVLGLDVGVGLFWVAVMLAPIAVAWLAERLTQRVWIALGVAAALGLVQGLFGGGFAAQIAGWAVEAANWDPRGFAAANVPSLYGLLFVVGAIATFAGRRGDGLMFFAAVALALWLGWELHAARVDAWRVVLESPLSRIQMGIGRGDSIVTARLALDGAQEWLKLRAVSDVLWLLAPAWIVGGATR